VQNRSLLSGEVSRGWAPGNLDPVTVLVGPDVRHLHRRLRKAEDVGGHNRRVLVRVGPVLDPHRLAVERVRPAGDIARRVDLREAGHAQPLVAADPVIERQSRRFQPLRRRPRADAHDDEIGGKHPPVGQRHAGHRARIGLQVINPDAGVQLDAVPAVQVRELLSDHLTEQVGHWHRLRLDDRHRAAVLARGRGQFRSDEARSDDHDPRCLGQGRAQRERVVGGADGVHAAQVAVRQRSWHQAGRDDQAVIAQGPPVLGPHGAGPRVQTCRAHAQLQVDVQRVQLRRGQQRHRSTVLVAGEHVLRQRRPVVRCVQLLADHGDPLAIPALAQRLGRPDSGDRSTHDQYRHGTSFPDLRLARNPPCRRAEQER
jgi:hypothetical protein